MSYDDHRCPCGGRKETGTLMCQACFAHAEVHSEFDLRRFRATEEGPEARRPAAIRLLAMARRRKGSRELPLQY